MGYGGARTKLKVGGGRTSGTGNFCFRAFHFFGSIQVQLPVVVLVSTFVMGSTVLSGSRLLFFYSYGAPVLVKWGARALPCPIESAPLIGSIIDWSGLDDSLFS